jgi:hypothetical protein
MKPETRLLSDPQRSFSPELLLPTFAILADAKPHVEQVWRAKEERGQIEEIQCKGHIGESFPGTAAQSLSGEARSSFAIGVP